MRVNVVIRQPEPRMLVVVHYVMYMRSSRIVTTRLACLALIMILCEYIFAFAPPLRADVERVQLCIVDHARIRPSASQACARLLIGTIACVSG